MRNYVPCARNIRFIIVFLVPIVAVVVDILFGASGNNRFHTVVKFLRIANCCHWAFDGVNHDRSSGSQLKTGISGID